MWKTVKLGDIADVKAGNPAPQDKIFFENGVYPFVRTSDVGKVKIGSLSDANDKLNQQGIAKLKLFPKGTILFPKSGASTFLNHRVILEMDAYVASHLATIKSKQDDISDKYLWYFLQTIDAANLVADSSYPSLNTKTIQSISVPLPPLAEQERIVAKLDAAFAKIDEAVELVQERFSRVEKALGQIVDIELSELREEYESCSLGEMLESVEYGTSTKCSKTGKYPVLRMGNMQTGSFVMDDLVYLDSDEELEKYRVRKDDVFFNRTNSALHVGKAAIYDGGSDCLFAGYLIRLNYSDDVLDGRFLNYYLNAPSTRAYGYSVMTSSVNQSNINGTKLKEYPFIKVDLKTQQCIRKKLDDLTALLSQVHFLLGKSLNEYAQLKSAILAQELQPSQGEAA